MTRLVKKSLMILFLGTQFHLGFAQQKVAFKPEDERLERVNYQILMKISRTRRKHVPVGNRKQRWN